MNRRQRESLRRRYQPPCVKLLFVGESPPTSGRFFYRCNSGLYRAMRDVFLTVEPSITHETFLKAFQEAGCYLVDLCLEPVDQLEPNLRRIACHAGERSLTRTIKKLQPQVIATLVRTTEANSKIAAAHAGWSGPFLHLPYPGRWSHHRKRFGAILAPHLLPLLQRRYYRNNIQLKPG